MWIALLALAWWLLRSFAPSGGVRRPQIGRQRDRRDAGEELVACESCGVYLPRRRALIENGEMVCSDSCRQQLQAGKSKPGR